MPRCTVIGRDSRVLDSQLLINPEAMSVVSRSMYQAMPSSPPQSGRGDSLKPPGTEAAGERHGER